MNPACQDQEDSRHAADAEALTNSEAWAIAGYNDFLGWLHDECGLDFVRRADGAIQDGYTMATLSRTYVLHVEHT